MPAALHAVALLVALCVQTTSSPLAGAWLLFHLAGCICVYRPPQRRDMLWWACLSWLLALSFTTFLLAPVKNGAVYFWILSTMPMLALALHERNLRPYIIALGGVVLLYACGLIAQQQLDVRYTLYTLESGARAWPLLDPNNAACIVNFGLIACFWLAWRHPAWWAGVAVFLYALSITQSKAGLLAALCACTVILASMYGKRVILLALLALAAAVPLLYWLAPDMLLKVWISYGSRLPIWQGAYPLLFIHPFLGVGLGSFPFYYAQARIEHYTAGTFAHNDLLQLAIETGFPVTLVFLVLAGCVVKTTSRANIAPFAVLLAVFIQAMIEFEFYLPSVSLLCGLALAAHARMREKEH